MWHKQGYCYTAPSWVGMGRPCTAMKHLFCLRHFHDPVELKAIQAKAVVCITKQTFERSYIALPAKGVTSLTWVLAQGIPCPDTIHCLCLHYHVLPSPLQLHDLHIWLLQHTTSSRPCIAISTNLALWPYRIDPEGLPCMDPVLSLHKGKFYGPQGFH